MIEYRRCQNVTSAFNLCGKVYQIDPEGVRAIFFGSHSYWCDECRKESADTWASEQAKLKAEYEAQQP